MSRFGMFLLLLSCVRLAGVYGQLNNQNLFWTHEKTDTAGLYLDLQGLGYFRNNEYFDLIEGYTLPGYQFNPNLRLQIDPHLSVTGGIFLLQYFGKNNIQEARPVFRINYAKNGFSLVLGNLHSALQHQLIEPVYDFERVIYDRLEQGVQLKWQKPGSFTDIWISWESFIFPGDDLQEEFWGGYSGKYAVLGRESVWQLNIPLQFTALHQGGQINQPWYPVITIYNYAAGIEILTNPALKSIKEISWQNYWTGHMVSSINNQLPADDGWGIYSNLGVSLNPFDLMLSYWYSREYIGSRGGILYTYRAFSDFFEGESEPERNLLVLRLMKEFHLAEKFNLVTRFEPLFDIDNQVLEYSFGIYLNFNPTFRLLDVKSF